MTYSLVVRGGDGQSGDICKIQRYAKSTCIRVLRLCRTLYYLSVPGTDRHQFRAVRVTATDSGICNNPDCMLKYTGHCPTLKFRFGRGYGANTKDIMQELKDKGVLKSVRKEQYRSDDPGKVILTPIKYAKDQNRDRADDIKCRGSKYILGYTGYIPGLNFRYGKSYSRAADDSMYEFSERQTELRRKWQAAQVYRASSAPKMNSIRARDDVSRSLKEYEEKVKFKGRTISPEYPPIAGYTGHIPRVKGNEASLSQRYYCVAKHGLSLLQEDRNRRNQLTDVESKIKCILNDTENKYK